MAYKISLSDVEYKELCQAISKNTNKEFHFRLVTIKYLYLGLKGKTIADKLDVCEDSITNWKKLYLDKGLQGLITSNHHKSGKDSVITPHLVELKAKIKAGFFNSLGKIRSWLDEEKGVKIGETGISKFLKKNQLQLQEN